MKRSALGGLLAGLVMVAPGIAGAVKHLASVMRPFSGRVVGVSDGDTLTVLRAGRGVRVRLHGVDSPEKRQAFGQRAKQFTSTLAFGKEVLVTPIDIDRYGRLVAKIHLPDGRMLQEVLLAEGFAWWYKQYAPNDSRFGHAEASARLARKGLWQDAEPIPPWAFRRSGRTPVVTQSPASPRRTPQGTAAVAPAVSF